MNPHLFNFTLDISKTNIPNTLNNPFRSSIPEIAQLAAKEFQAFIEKESQNWQPELLLKKGKLFGMLVVQKLLKKRSSI
ncbi:hypothetical protein [Acidiluteibacter ferrifornacis]|uniref:Uncharacterized protein n=1 Tax=Acidiluteibacter ferrifornacis TaxID=2692424 RepID=A0A6N9NL08_9FLAO|nr:hypothetical protein [Acidiluteibacter ferrifornacis]NBG67386.1 hypothetical protein [Acidiluteibacter ferrifornacis]